MEDNNRFENTLFSMTTPIYAIYSAEGKTYKTQGTGFYYNEVLPTQPDKVGPQWYQLKSFWLVTNRHVALPRDDKGTEYIPDSFTFCLREVVDDEIRWLPVTILKTEFLTLLKVHSSEEVDVAVIDVSSYIQNLFKEINEKKRNIMIPTTLSNLNLPANQPIEIDVTSDIIVASYPKNFYDEKNKFPIIKSGIVASAWNYDFKGLPMFQIDAQLFPGSSGGLVLSKPTNIATFGGQIQFNKTKQFVFLGIYSGEYKWYETIEIGGNQYRVGNSYGLGNVWYSHLVPNIIENGIPKSEST